MSPMPRVGRRSASFLLGSILVAGALLALASAPVAAQDDAPEFVRALSLRAVEDTAGCPEGKAPCWDLQTLVAAPGDAVSITANLAGAQPHDLTLEVDGEELQTPTDNGVHQLNFTFPEGATSIDYFCSVHPTTMTGSIKIQSELGVAEEEAIPEMGVHFLAYWVGVIAFALLFIIYGLTFFLFKYNETPATTDHWDRSDAAAAGRTSKSMAGLLAVVIAVAALAAIIWIARR